MADKAALVIGSERGTGLLIAQALGAAGFRLTAPAESPQPDSARDSATGPDRVVLVLNGNAATLDALVDTRLQPFHETVDRFAGPLRDRDGALLVVVLLPPGAGLWQAMAADWIAAGIARCAADWGPAGPRINGIVAVLDDSPALPRFLAPRPAGAAALRPADVAATALALCADSAAAITGQVLRMGDTGG